MLCKLLYAKKYLFLAKAKYFFNLYNDFVEISFFVYVCEVVFKSLNFALCLLFTLEMLKHLHAVSI